MSRHFNLCHTSVWHLGHTLPASVDLVLSASAERFETRASLVASGPARGRVELVEGLA